MNGPELGNGADHSILTGAGPTLIRVALPISLEHEFDYLAARDEQLVCGAWVEVRLGGHRHVGVVVEFPSRPAVDMQKLKPIGRVLEQLPPLSQAQLKLASFLAQYYQVPYGMALALLQPPTARPKRDNHSVMFRLTPAGRAVVIPPRARLQSRLRALLDDGSPHHSDELARIGSGVLPLLRRWQAANWVERAPESAAVATAIVPRLPLNEAQKRAAAEISDCFGRFVALVLHGVTGSGKTMVYLQAAASAIARNGQVLLLVPEINLTPQLAEYIRSRLVGVRLAILHSGLNASQRALQWWEAARGEAQLVVGTRLAVFAALPRLALIIVDEEHDPSFKQQEGVRYHARDVALYRAQQHGVPIVLGSATPALETYHLACSGRYRLLELSLRAASASLPPIRFARQADTHGNDGLSDPLLAALKVRLTRGEQSLLFINRRGYAPSLLCRACGWAAPCSRCAARLVVHLDAGDLRCHHCGLERTLPRRCPECGDYDLRPVGYGTQRLEAALVRRFPRARVLRIDRDTTRRRNAWPEMLASIQKGEADILVGTQMLAKGHDFPRLTLVGVLGADNALYSADFRATERVFAQLLQVSGRAGRGELAGEVIVQTDYPTHPVYRALADHDYRSLTATLLAERRRAKLPPFSYVALLRAEAQQRKAVDTFLDQAYELANRTPPAASVRVYAPVSAALARRAGYERAQMLFQSAARKPLLALLRAVRIGLRDLPSASRVRWAFDVDPIQLD